MLWGVYGDRLNWTLAGKADRPAWMSVRSRDVPFGNSISLSTGTAYCVRFPNFVSVKPPAGGHTWLTKMEGKGVIVKALVAAGDRLVVASRVKNPLSPAAGDIRILSASGGKELGRTLLPAPPCFDGLALGSGVLAVRLEDGRVGMLSGAADGGRPARVGGKAEAGDAAGLATHCHWPARGGSARHQLLKTAKLPLEKVGDVLAGLAGDRYRVVVAAADAATLKGLGGGAAA